MQALSPVTGGAWLGVPGALGAAGRTAPHALAAGSPALLHILHSLRTQTALGGSTLGTIARLAY